MVFIAGQGWGGWISRSWALDVLSSRCLLDIRWRCGQAGSRSSEFRAYASAGDVCMCMVSKAREGWSHPGTECR